MREYSESLAQAADLVNNENIAIEETQTAKKEDIQDKIVKDQQTELDQQATLVANAEAANAAATEDPDAKPVVPKKTSAAKPKTPKAALADSK